MHEPDERSAASTPAYRWIGAARIRGNLGLTHVTWPLVAFTLNGSSLELGLRNRVLRWMSGAPPLTATAGGEEIFAASDRLGRMWVGIQHAGQEGYFYIEDIRPVLALLSQHGFGVSADVRKIPFV